MKVEMIFVIFMSPHSIFNAGSLADGNVYFKNTTSNVDNGTNVTDTSIVSGFIYDTNFKIIE